MPTYNSHLSTGISGLDNILKGILPGDNVVWQVDSIREYKKFVQPYCNQARGQAQKIIYFHFSTHTPLITEEEGEIHNLNPHQGFEAFITHIHTTIANTGRGGYYIFDPLSDLAIAWHSDQMLGNFFMLTCPYLLDMEALAYFGIYKNRHSFRAISPILDTTQIFIDVYNYKNSIYIHPIKVQQRYSKTMQLLHQWKNNDFIPVVSSALNAEILTSKPWPRQESASQKHDIWTKTILEAENILNEGKSSSPDENYQQSIKERLIHMYITRDSKIAPLVDKYFTLKKLLNISKRMVGSGLIGGKSVGMLLARAILLSKDRIWEKMLETHDSFYIGSDVFYTFLVINGCWWLKNEQSDLSSILNHAHQSRRRILTGKFPEYIIKEFTDMLNYFGPCPIIVRSSSLLEDNFGNAFSGKYESVFCPNQGSKDKRLEDFMTAIRTIYASALSEKALRYRDQFNLLNKDEQMSLLVQRVSGSFHNRLFYPDFAGVGYSFNPFVWHNDIDPEAGVLRLVAGMGTRAVERVDDDYTRIVALNAPLKRPESTNDEIQQYSQKKLDAIDLDANQLVSVSIQEVVKNHPDQIMLRFMHQTEEEEFSLHKINSDQITSEKNLNFNKLFETTDFAETFRNMLQTVSQAYNYPVDIEFTANLGEENSYHINLVQCRPFQMKSSSENTPLKEKIEESDLILKSDGPVIGENRTNRIDRIIFVVPEIYGNMPLSDRYTIARLIGKVTNLNLNQSEKRILLIGPGRWGTTTPFLGVPVSFSEIDKISYICEIVSMHKDLTPDVSLGTHFFNDLVDLNILYLALYPKKTNSFINGKMILKSKNNLLSLLPQVSEAPKYEHALKVIDFSEDDQAHIYARNNDPLVICYKK